ncbi:cytochrome P450 [Saccharomonospora halophila]|uniref:cytochrome P450 n=1 Tax=Saccharomonospora halophila TaxID=129922 RepID=UPI00036822EF|nr:cytochrome P450 [Saccharomonospora halophila]
MTPHPTDDRTDDRTDNGTDDSVHNRAADPATATRELTDDFDPRAPETFTSAHELYRGMREHCPVAHSEGFDGGFWALFRHSDVNRVLRNPDTFTTSVQNTVPKFAFTGRRPPLHLDPPEHTAYRRVINRFFTPTKMRALHPTVRQLAVEQLTPLFEAGAGDISVDYAQKFPALVFAEFFNLPRELSTRIKEISAAYVAAIIAVDDETVKQLSGKLYAIAQDVIDQRRAEPMDPEADLTTALTQATYEGEPLPPDMVLGCVRQLLVTGMVAPSVFIGNMFVHLSRDPELQTTLRENPDRIPAAVEEFLRLYGPYRGMARTAREDVVFDGRLIKAGEPIALVYTSANRDGRVFPDGENFVFDRPNLSEHISFGAGVHSCPGAPLARMMLTTTLEEALARTDDFAVTGEIVMAKWAEWGTNSVPMRFVPAGGGARGA